MGHYKQTESVIEATGCQFSSQHLRRSSGSERTLLAGISLSAAVSCAQASKNLFVLTDLLAQINVENEHLTLTPVTKTVFGAKGSGSIQADLRQSIDGSFRSVDRTCAFPA
ncbi:MAG: hypothetical protein WDZ52_04500 [Pseudohongiellaceae bacterium]